MPSSRECPGCILLADMVFIDSVDLSGRGAAAVAAVGGAVARIGRQRDITVGTGPETEGDVRLDQAGPFSVISARAVTLLVPREQGESSDAGVGGRRRGAAGRRPS